MKNYIPILQWIKKYNRNSWKGDLSAGLTVGVMLIPQGMAYSMLAGLPPIYGLYASTVPLILYAIFGTSRQLAVGPVAMVALLIAGGIGNIAEVGSSEFISLAILLSLMVGLFQLGMGLFRLGFLVNFLSHPVIAGFTSAAAIIIGTSQLKHLLGISIPRGKVHETLLNVSEHFTEINWYTVMIGGVSIATILILRKINKRIPSPLVVVVLGLSLVYFMGLSEEGVKIVGDVPAGVPSFQLPNINWNSFVSLVPIALTISLVGFMESIAVAKSIQKKYKDYDVVSNQELIALGAANIGGAFFQAFPTTGGFSRTAVNDQAGAKSGMASIISAALVLITLLFLTDYFYFLPKAVLAAIIMVAVFGLIDWKEAKHLWRTDRQDFWMFMITAISTLLLGVEEGIAVGVGVSIIGLLMNASYPHIAELGEIGESGKFLNVDRFEDAKVKDGVLIVRLDAQLFFANTGYFLERLKELERKREKVNTVILNAVGMNRMDSSGVHMIADLVEEYNQRGVQFLMTNVKGPIRDTLKKSNLTEKIGEQNFFLTLSNAMRFLEEGTLSEKQRLALQTNNDGK